MDHRVRTRSVSKPELLNEWRAEPAGEVLRQSKPYWELDINTADTHRLKRLNGIGERYAKKLIEGRPYRDREDLLVRNILPLKIYARIRERLYAGPS
jgi:DNA uptake protein ComE-like DNA-binding protein